MFRVGELAIEEQNEEEEEVESDDEKGRGAIVRGC